MECATHAVYDVDSVIDVIFILAWNIAISNILLLCLALFAQYTQLKKKCIYLECFNLTFYDNIYLANKEARLYLLAIVSYLHNIEQFHFDRISIVLTISVRTVYISNSSHNLLLKLKGSWNKLEHGIEWNNITFWSSNIEKNERAAKECGRWFSFKLRIEMLSCGWDGHC